MTEVPHWRAMTDSKYLAAYDLVDASGKPCDVTLQIQRVEGGIVEGEGGMKSRKPILHFAPYKGRKPVKPMVCNATNSKTIASIVGSPAPARWHEQWVTLYATTTKDKRTGEDVPCIRVRPFAPKQAANAAQGSEGP